MLDKLKKMAYEDKEPFGMVELALIYLGDPLSDFLQLGQPAINQLHGTNKTEGFALIDKALQEIEQGKPPLVYGQYSRIANIYRIEKKNYESDEVISDKYLDILRNQHKFEALALKSIENGGGLTPAELMQLGGQIPQTEIDHVREMERLTKIELESAIGRHAGVINLQVGIEELKTNEDLRLGNEPPKAIIESPKNEIIAYKDRSTLYKIFFKEVTPKTKAVKPTAVEPPKPVAKVKPTVVEPPKPIAEVKPPAVEPPKPVAEPKPQPKAPAPAHKFCGDCGTPNPKQDPFCGVCGKNLKIEQV